MVAVGRLDVHLVEGSKIRARATADDDPRLLRLPDVPSPQLVEAGEDVVESAIGEWDLEHETWLHVAEAGTRAGLLGPAAGAQALDGLGAGPRMPIGEHLADPVRRIRRTGLPLGYRGLDRVGLPAAQRHGRAHLHLEGALGAAVRQQRIQPVVQGQVWLLGAEPVDIRAFGKVGEGPLRQPRHRPVENMTRTHQPGGLEPAQ
jgi:hypothetical protein